MRIQNGIADCWFIQYLFVARWDDTMIYFQTVAIGDITTYYSLSFGAYIATFSSTRAHPYIWTDNTRQHRHTHHSPDTNDWLAPTPLYCTFVDVICDDNRNPCTAYVQRTQEITWFEIKYVFLSVDIFFSFRRVHTPCEKSNFRLKKLNLLELQNTFDFGIVFILSRTRAFSAYESALGEHCVCMRKNRKISNTKKQNKEKKNNNLDLTYLLDNRIVGHQQVGDDLFHNFIRFTEALCVVRKTTKSNEIDFCKITELVLIRTQYCCTSKHK